MKGSLKNWLLSYDTRKAFEGEGTEVGINVAHF